MDLPGGYPRKMASIKTLICGIGQIRLSRCHEKIDVILLWIQKHELWQGRLRVLLLPGLFMLLAAVVYLPYLDYVDLTHEEPKRVLMARNMLEGGSWLVPYTEDLGNYLIKPPGYSWAVAVVSHVLGEVNAWNARMTSVFSAMLLTTFMLLITRSMIGPIGRSVLGLALIFSPELAIKATLAEIDILFTFFVSASLWTWFYLWRQGMRDHRLWWLSATLVGLAFLTKRETALVFYYFSVFAFLWIKGQQRLLWSQGHISAMVVTLGLCCLWWIPAMQTAGVATFLQTLVSEAGKTGSAPGFLEVVEHWFSYPFAVLSACLPFSFLLVLLFLPDMREKLRDQYGEVYTFCLVALVVNFPLYWLLPDAAVRYFAPMMPTMLVLCAMLIETAWRGSPETMVQRMIRGIGTITLVLALLPAIFMLIMPFSALTFDSPMPLFPWLGIGMGFLCIGGIVLFWRYKVDGIRLWFSFAILAIILRMFYINGVYPLMAQKIAHRCNLSGIITDIAQQIPLESKVQALVSLPEDFWFYAPRKDMLISARRLNKTHTITSRYILTIDKIGAPLPNLPATIIKMYPCKKQYFLLYRLFDEEELPHYAFSPPLGTSPKS